MLSRLVLGYLLAFPAMVALTLQCTVRGQAYTVVVRMSAVASGPIQVFFDTGTGFSEKQSIQTPLRPSTAPQEDQFLRPAGTYRGLRIHPGTSGGLYIIEYVGVRTCASSRWLLRRLAALWVCGVLIVFGAERILRPVGSAMRIAGQRALTLAQKYPAAGLVGEASVSTLVSTYPVVFLARSFAQPTTALVCCTTSHPTGLVQPPTALRACRNGRRRSSACRATNDGVAAGLLRGRCHDLFGHRGTPARRCGATMALCGCSGPRQPCNRRHSTICRTIQPCDTCGR